MNLYNFLEAKDLIEMKIKRDFHIDAFIYYELLILVLDNLHEDMFDRESFAKKIIDRFIEVMPSDSMSGNVKCYQLLTIKNGGVVGGHSRKIRNIIIKTRKLIDIIPDLVLTSAGTLSSQWWIIFFAPLHIWKTLCCNADIELDRNHAMAIYALWKNVDLNNKISKNLALQKVNERLQGNNFKELNEDEFNKVIDRLCRIGCIKIEYEEISLIESVKIE